MNKSTRRYASGAQKRKKRREELEELRKIKKIDHVFRSHSTKHGPDESPGNIQINRTAGEFSTTPPQSSDSSHQIDVLNLNPIARTATTSTTVTYRYTETGVEQLVEEDAENIPIVTVTNQDDEKLSNPSTKDKIDAQGEDYENGFSWINCVGELQYFVEHVKTLLNDIQELNEVNVFSCMTKVIDVLEDTKHKCGNLLEKCNKVVSNMERNEIKIVASTCFDSVPEHDPGKRSKINNDKMRKYLISLGPHQPQLSHFPTDSSISKHKQCRFSPTWYAQFPHLEYSIVNDTAYCFICCLFPEGPGRGHGEHAWNSTGVRQWSKMKSVGKAKQGKLAQHFTSQAHKAALSDYCNFLQKNHHIDMLLDKERRKELIQHEQEIAFNTEIVSILADVALVLGRQGIAFRGTDSEDDSGNFKQIVRLISRHCPIMNKWLQMKKFRPYHTTYMSAQSQNEFIQVIGEAIRERIINGVNSAQGFAVMADTTPDVSNTDKMAVVTRYIDSQGKVNERLLQVITVSDKTGEGTAKTIVSTLKDNTVDLSKLIFQSYDYTNSMSGHVNGAQQKLSEILGRDIPYIPCQDHRINIFVEHACIASTTVTELFSLLEEVYVFFSSSTKRSKLMTEKLSEIENSLKLTNLSKTRWTARAESINAIWTSYEAIVEVLIAISLNKKFDNKTRSRALGIRKKMLSFDAVVSIMFMKNILYKTKHLTEALEAPNLNFLDAFSLLKATTRSFQQIVNDEQSIDSQIASSVCYAEKLGIDVERDFKLHHRRRVAPLRIDENRESQHEFDLHSFYRKEFKDVLNTFASLMQDNLNSSLLIMEPLFQVFQIPISKENLSLENINKLVQFFPKTVEAADPLCIQADLEMLSNLSDNVKSMKDIFQISEKMKAAIPLANYACRIVLTAPVSVAKNERSFSKLKLIKNCLRSTTGDARLDSLMLMSCEKDLADSVELKDILKRWTRLKTRRIQIKVN